MLRNLRRGASCLAFRSNIAGKQSSGVIISSASLLKQGTSMSQFGAFKLASFSTKSTLYNQQANQETSTDETVVLGQNIFQFIQEHSANLPTDKFTDIDKLLQTLIFQAHQIFKGKSMEEWQPIFYELLNILSNNSQIFAEIGPNQVAEVEQDVKIFADAITGTFEKYATLGGENKLVGDFMRILSEDLIISALPTIKFGADHLREKYIKNVIGEMDKLLENEQTPFSFKVIMLSRKSLCYHKIGDYDNALTTANKLIELVPNFSPAYLTRASTYLFQEKAEEAIADCNRTLELEPANLEAYLCRAVAYMRIGDTKKALSDLNVLLEAHPSRFDALTKRAGLYFGEKKYDMGIIDVERALYFNSNDVQVFSDVVFSFDCANDKYAEQLIVGLFNKTRGQTAEALKAFDEAIKINPNEPTAYHQRGLLLYNFMNQAKDALEDFEAALQNRDKITSKDYMGILLQDYGMVVLNLFVSEYKEKAPEVVPTFETAPPLQRAFNSFSEAITYLPKQAQLKALSSIGSIHVIMNENEQGIETFTKALEMSKPKDPSEITRELRGDMAAALFNRAHVYHMKMLKHEEALKDYSAAIKLNPNNPLFYHYRSLLHIAMGNDELSKKDEDLAKKIQQRQEEAMMQMKQMQNQMQNRMENQPQGGQ